jgi:hypothetical protein
MYDGLAAKTCVNIPPMNLGRVARLWRTKANLMRSSFMRFNSTSEPWLGYHRFWELRIINTLEDEQHIKVR